MWCRHCVYDGRIDGFRIPKEGITSENIFGMDCLSVSFESDPKK